MVFYHFATRGMVRIGHIHPPLRLYAVDLAGFGAQLQKVYCRPEARLLYHAPDGLGIDTLEACLHKPDLAHIGLEAALYGQLAGLLRDDGVRSEEHTSELQSLMRIS